VSRGVGDDTLDGSSHLEGGSGGHDDLDTGSLRLHELGKRAREERRVSEVL
jgi:hypothetical protein